MTPVALSPLAPGAGATATGLASLSPGQVLTALVQGRIDDTTLRFLIAGRPLDLATDTPLAPGTRVEIAVAGTPDQLRLTLRPLPASPSPPQVPADAVEAEGLRSAVALVGGAAARQGGLAALAADLTALAARPDLPVPPAVLAAARQVLASRVDAEDGVEPDAVRSALLGSGLIAAAGTPPARGDSLQQALQQLRSALAQWAETAAEPSLSSSSPPLSNSAPAPRGPGLPFRDLPTAPQPPVAPSLPLDAAPAEIARHLLAGTDGAIARQTLMQIASLADEAAGASRRDAPLHLTFDLPLMTPQGTAAAQLRIERDGRAPNGEVAAAVWRIGFSIDVEPIGPVHARINLIGERAAVTLKAERAGSAERLARDLPRLEAGLREAALEPGELRCSAGAPSTPSAASSAAPGQLLDHAT